MTPRYKRGDQHPSNAELFFIRYKRGKEVWNSLAFLSRVREQHRLLDIKQRGRPETREYMKKYFQKYNSTPKQKAYHSSYYKRPDVRARIRAKYHSDPTVKEKIRSYCKKQQRNYIWYRFARNLRTRLSRALKRNIGATKASTLRDLIGCSIQALRIHLESQFTIEMSWENYGTYWHVDHKLPLSLFDLTKPEQQKIAFNFENLQPLQALENMRKSDKVGETTGRQIRKVIPFKAA